VTLKLTDNQQAMLSGSDGNGCQIAMRMVVAAAEALTATRLVEIKSAHVTSCFYSGQVNVDFAEHLVANGAKVAVPTTLNASSMDFVHPELTLVDADLRGVAGAKRLGECYLAMGCNQTWTCAPYHIDPKPAFGENIAGSESNAVVFSNSVLGARTNLYGDFLDIGAAITGYVPYAGLHRDEPRRGEIVFDVQMIPDSVKNTDIFFNALGYVIGRESGSQIPVVVGLLPTTSEDQLKALGSTAACAGAVKMFHAVGVTPEAMSLEQALQGGRFDREITISATQIVAASDALCTATNGTISAVCMGTPHFSVSEFQSMMPLLSGRKVHADVRCYISTSRHTIDLIKKKGWLAELQDAGITIVADRCTYNIPRLDGVDGVVMTNSAKWAYYGPGNVGAKAVFASLKECLDSAVAGRVVRDPDLWLGLD